MLSYNFLFLGLVDWLTITLKISKLKWNLIKRKECTRIDGRYSLTLKQLFLNKIKTENKISIPIFKLN